MQTLAQNVTDTLRDWILHGQVPPGGRLEEVPLAEQLGVSRTPVRAALGTLANEGLIDHQPKRGYLVRVFDLEDIVAAYEVRAILEGLACRNAAVRGLTDDQAQRLKTSLADGDSILASGVLRPEDHEPYQQTNVTIHDTLLTASGNPWVTRFAEQAQNIPFASDRIVLWNDHAIILRSHGDHHRIVEAVIARDSLRAEQLMREHVYYAGIILRRNYEKLLEAEAGSTGTRAKPAWRTASVKASLLPD
jgi:GntR family transcriptional regulator of vanillate catabolism